MEINNKSYIARNLQNIALGLMQQGKHAEARKKFEESLILYRELNDYVQLAKIVGNIGALEYLSENYEEAITAFEESLNLRSDLGDRQGMSIALNNLGSVAYMQKNFEESSRFLEESLDITRDLGDRRIMVTTISTLGSIAFDTDDIAGAVRYFTESINISNELGDNYTISKGLEGFAGILLKLKKYKEACLIGAKYAFLLESSNKNLIEGELIRINEMKTNLKMNLSVKDYEKYWAEGMAMSVEEAIEHISLINVEETI
ncbi:MAG: tetratricopeptide repeat protein [Ignavibacteria bacterium]